MNPAASTPLHSSTQIPTDVASKENKPIVQESVSSQSNDGMKATFPSDTATVSSQTVSSALNASTNDPLQSRNESLHATYGRELSAEPRQVARETDQATAPLFGNAVSKEFFAEEGFIEDITPTPRQPNITPGETPQGQSYVISDNPHRRDPVSVPRPQVAMQNAVENPMVTPQHATHDTVPQQGKLSNFTSPQEGRITSPSRHTDPTIASFQARQQTIENKKMSLEKEINENGLNPSPYHEKLIGRMKSNIMQEGKELAQDIDSHQGLGFIKQQLGNYQNGAPLSERANIVRFTRETNQLESKNQILKNLINSYEADPSSQKQSSIANLRDEIRRETANLSGNILSAHTSAYARVQNEQNHPFTQTLQGLRSQLQNVGQSFSSRDYHSLQQSLDLLEQFNIQFEMNVDLNNRQPGSVDKEYLNNQYNRIGQTASEIQNEINYLSNRSPSLRESSDSFSTTDSSRSSRSSSISEQKAPVKRAMGKQPPAPVTREYLMIIAQASNFAKEIQKVNKNPSKLKLGLGADKMSISAAPRKKGFRVGIGDSRAAVVQLTRIVDEYAREAKKGNRLPPEIKTIIDFLQQNEVARAALSRKRNSPQLAQFNNSMSLLTQKNII